MPRPLTVKFFFSLAALKNVLRGRPSRLSRPIETLQELCDVTFRKPSIPEDRRGRGRIRCYKLRVLNKCETSHT